MVLWSSQGVLENNEQYRILGLDFMPFFFSRFFLVFFIGIFLPNFVFAASTPVLPTAVEDCHNKLAITYNQGGMTYQQWLIDYKQCYLDNNAAKLVPDWLHTYATTTNTFDNNFATADCVVVAQRWYSDQIGQCLQEKSAPLQKYQDLSPEDLINRAVEFQGEIQKVTMEVQSEQQKCYSGSLLDEFKKRNARCYQKSDFGGIWELPVLKQALTEQLSDYQNLSPEKNQQLSICLESVFQNYDLHSVSASAQEAMSSCFTGVGLQGLGNVYQKISVVVDCAQTRFPLKTSQDVVRVATNQTPEDQAYLEQCVIKKIAPAVTAVAVANVPLAAGWRSIFLFGQLLVTQPIILIRRRRYKTWGTVFDTTTTNPVDLSSVRLIDSKKNQVIATTVTDKRGSYLFLPEPGNYRVEVDKPGYIFPSVLLARHAYEYDHYFGESMETSEKNDVIDRHIPIDPTAQPLAIWRFRLRQWQSHGATILGFVSPAISIIGFILVPRWWVGLFVVAHLLIFGIFVRLSTRDKVRKFGIVMDKQKKSMTAVTVSLFRSGDNKLLNYYVTDLFGRYYFPRLVGDYRLIFEKKGFKKKELTFSIHHEDREKTTVKYDIILEKI